MPPRGAVAVLFSAVAVGIALLFAVFVLLILICR